MKMKNKMSDIDKRNEENFCKKCHWVVDHLHWIIVGIYFLIIILWIRMTIYLIIQAL